MMRSPTKTSKSQKVHETNGIINLSILISIFIFFYQNENASSNRQSVLTRLVGVL